MTNKIRKPISAEISEADILVEDLKCEGHMDPRVFKFVVRLPEGLRNQIKSLSKVNCRSMNSEIITALKKHEEESQLKKVYSLKNANGEGLGGGIMPTEKDVNERLKKLEITLSQLLSKRRG